MSERSEDNSIVTKPIIGFTHLAFRRGWFRADGGCILAKRGNEGGFVATPAFTSQEPGATLASRLIYLTRHGRSESVSSRSSCSGAVRSAAPSGITTPCSGSSRTPSLTHAAGAVAEAASSCSSRASRGSRHGYVYCTSEEADSVASAPMRGKLSQHSAEDAAGPREHPCTADSSSLTSTQLVQPSTVPKKTALDSQISRGAHAPVASSVRRDDTAAEESSSSAANCGSLASQGFVLSGAGWIIPIMVKDGLSALPEKGASTAEPSNEEAAQQCWPQHQDETAQAEINEAPSECSSYLSTANTLQLSGQGWTMPVRLHDTMDEASSKLPEVARNAPKQGLAIKSDTHGASAQELLSSIHDAADIGCLSPRERIQLLERSCSSTSLPLPGQASPVKQYPRLCNLTRLAPCDAIVGSPSGHRPGSADSAPSAEGARRCDLGHTIAKNANAGKLVAPPAPDERRASSSASGDTGLGALIAAGRDLPNRASESSQHCDYRNRAASDVDSASEKGASSIEGHLPLQLDVHRRSQPYIDSSRQRAFSGACSLEDEQQGTESRHASSQHGSGSSIYGTPQPSLSSLSQASAATCAPDKRESNPLYACSSSGASSGIRGAQANPYYACSTSSASSGSALPQRQPFWPHAAQAALATSSMLSFTAQSIPEDAASEDNQQDDDQLPSRPHELLALLLVPLKLKGDCCNVAVLNASAACLALSQTLPPDAEEIVAEDSHVTRILNAHIGLPDEGGKLQTVVPVMSLADFPDPAAAAQHVKAVMLGYPHTNAVILREAGILCWGLMTHAQALVELYEYLLKCSCDMAQEAPPQRKSCVLSIRRTDTANEELYLERSCGASSTGHSCQHPSSSPHSHDVEEGLKELMNGEEAPRPVRWNQPLMVIISCAIILGILFTGVGFAIRDALKDGSWWKVAARAATMPIISALALFGTIAIVSCIIISLGPIAHVEQNSKTYSAIPPPRWQGKLPRVTIQMPIYLEGFDFVIKPSIRSLLAAIAAYKAEGGSASLFVNDDGLQLLSDQDREERLEFYRQHDIGFVARPPHGKAGFLRAGRFKKASNMNYCLEISRQVETIMQEEIMDQYEALQEVRLRTLAQTPDQAFLAGGDVRIGEYILLVDSDTRVPEHCILPTVTELMNSPEVAFTQHYTTPLQVSHDYFENAMAFFTKTIYNAIMLSVSGGDISPLVGHNAFLRWAYMKQCAFQDTDGQTKYWSDAHVSEDFDIAIRFQVRGYTGRYITYTGPDFKEGLSLSIHDEISRMRKYAFGCSELVFNPLSHWLCRGPIAKLFRTYLWNACTPITNKLTIVAYICIYIALAIAWPVAVTTYFLNSKCAWYAKTFEGTFEISMTCLVVFSILTPVGNTFMMYRLGVTSLLQGAWQNMKYSLVFFFFFNGLSFHLSAAFASHLLGFKMTWGSTTKEIADTNFFKELHATFRNYCSMYIVFSLLALMTFVMTGVIPHTVPPEWCINDAIFIVPISFLVGGHLLAPLVLNPSIMRITF